MRTPRAHVIRARRKTTDGKCKIFNIDRFKGLLKSFNEQPVNDKHLVFSGQGHKVEPPKKMTLLEMQSKIKEIENKKGIVSNEEIQHLVNLRSQLSYRTFFK